jgi:ABC-type antimicrobial peptide transport system permease subunit
MHVVGVVDDVRNTAPNRTPPPEVFIEFHQALAMQARWGDSVARQNEMSIGFLSFAIRARGNPEPLVPAVGRLVRDVDPNAGVDAIIPLDRLVAMSVARQRFNAVVIGVFAAVACLLAGLGIYGVLAYTVIQRTQEIGIRMALGARPAQVMSLVLGHGATLTAIGIGLGLTGAAAGARLLQSLLFGVTPLDTGTFVAVAVGFAVVAGTASLIPARRATQVDPLVALRAE